MGKPTTDELIELFDRTFSEDSLKRLCLGIWDHDRWCTWEEWKKGAQLCADALRDGGVTDVEMIPWRTDEEHATGRCRMTDTWEVQRGELSIVHEDGRHEKVADYRDNPWHLILRSPHTPAGGVTADVVCVDEVEELAALPNAAVRGRIVLTGTRCRPIMRTVLEKGGIGIVSHHPVPDMPQAVGWRKFGMLGWRVDEPKRCWGFSLSAEQGERLRKLASTGRLRLHALIEGRVGTEEVYSVTGRIPGEVDTEILCNGHLQEPGVTDNASGCAVLVQAMAALNRLIADGVLAPPRKGLRILLGYEWTGSLTFFDRRPEITHGLRFGLCLDGIGARQDTTPSKSVGLNPPMNAHCTDVYMADLIERLTSRYDVPGLWSLTPFGTGTDCRQADPSYDVPTVTVCAGGGYRGYHSSGDGPEILDSRLLKIHAVLAATFLYDLATADTEDARRLLAGCERVGRAAVESLRLRAFGERSQRQDDGIDVSSFDPPRKYAAVDFLETRETTRLRGVLDVLYTDDQAAALEDEVETSVAAIRSLADGHRGRLGEEAATGLEATLDPSDVARAQAVVPVRLVPGDPWSENLSAVDRQRISVPGSSPDVVWWSDGRRTIYDCWRLSLTERPQTTLKGVLRYVDALVEMGWVELRPACGEPG